MEGEVKEYSWKFATVDMVLCNGPCELEYFNVAPSAGAAECALYNGVDTSGELIIPVYLAVQLNYEYNPNPPIYCSKGLFIDIGDNVTGVLVQWRELPQ